MSRTCVRQTIRSGLDPIVGLASAAKLKPAVALVLVPCSALAHGERDHLGSRWTLDPFVLLPLAACLLLYLAGITRLWKRAGWGRGIHVWNGGVYLAGWCVLAAALISPLHWAGEQIFTFHMVEHEVIMAVAAPLLVLGQPVAAAIWSLPRKARRAAARAWTSGRLNVLWAWLTRPVNATLLHGLAIWVWHLPKLLELSVENPTTHRLQHLSFLLTALIFWWAITRCCDHGIAVWHLFVTMLHTSVLGALLALAPRLLYPIQTAHAPDWGLSAMEDQQLAGLIMWAPGGAIYAAGALIFAALWIRRSGRPSLREQTG